MTPPNHFLTVLIFLISVLLLTGCSSQPEQAAPVEMPRPGASSESGISEPTTEKGESAVVASVEDVDEESDDEFDEEDELDEFEEEFEEAKTEVNDPFEGYNRMMTSFNDVLFTNILEPIGRGYAYVVPETPRRGVRNFFHNLLYPVRVVNNLLQLKLKNAGEETLRFVTNTTIGIFGFWDPAREWFGLEPHEEDFGQTLGYYGVGSGPHIVLPFFGPSNLRDTFSMYPDKYLDPVGQEEPIGQTDSYVAEYGVRGFKAVNAASLSPGQYENLKKDAVDFYPFLRDSYEQMRNKEIKE